MEALNKYIGPCCIVDEFLKGVIETNAENNRCDYCGKLFKGPTCSAIEHVAEAIREAIEEHYTRQEEVPYADGEYLHSGESTASIARDLSADYISQESDDVSIMEDLKNILGHDDFWVDRREWPGNSQLETLWLWETFKKLVQYKNRYFFGTKLGSGEEFRYAHLSSPMELLEGLCGRLQLDESLTVLDPETKIYRVRKHMPGIDRSNPSEFCAPPPEKCLQSNRMSPPGIQMFYGALDRETARLEVNTNAPYYLAEFRTTRRVLLIDLTKQFDRRSMFEPESRWWNDYAELMSGFVSDLASPIENDDRIHIEYIPTQVVAEYLRIRPRTSKPEGFRFPSHRGAGGQNIAFFGNPVVGLESGANSTASAEDPSNPFLKYIRVRRIWT